MTVGLLALFCSLPLIACTFGESSNKGSCGNNPSVSLAAKSVGGEYIGVYEPCCKGHDDCYDRCQGKEACDDVFGSCLTTACAGRGVECANVAALFYTAVEVPSVSSVAYEAACLAVGRKAGTAPLESIPFASEPFLLSKGSHKLGHVTINVNQLGEWQITRKNIAKEVRSQRTLSKMMEEGLISPEISAAVGNIARKHNISLRGEDLAIRIADSHGSQNMTVSNLRLGVSSSVGQFELSLSDLHLAQHNSQGLRTFEEHKLLHLHFVAAGPKGEFFAQAITSAQNFANTFHGRNLRTSFSILSVQSSTGIQSCVSRLATAVIAIFITSSVLNAVSNFIIRHVSSCAIQAVRTNSQILYNYNCPLQIWTII